MKFKILCFRIKNKFLKSIVDFSVILVLFFIASFNLFFLETLFELFFYRSVLFLLCQVSNWISTSAVKLYVRYGFYSVKSRYQCGGKNKS